MFRSAGSTAYIFKTLKATVRGGGGGGGRTPNVKVALNISASHSKNVVQVIAHPDNQGMATRLAAAAHGADFFDWLARFNIVVATGEFALKVYRVFVKAKQSGLNEAVKGIVKGDVCSFKRDERLDNLVTQSELHSRKMDNIAEMIEHVAKHSGCPPPPRPNVKNNGGGANGNGGGAKGNGSGAKGNGGGTKSNGGGAKGNGGGANGD